MTDCVGKGLKWLLAGALATSSAWAAPGEDAGLVRLLPLGDMVGDGETVSTLHLLALRSDGTPYVGARLKASVSQGTLGEPVELGGGLYQLALTAPSVSAEQTLSVDVKVKTADRQTYDVSGEVKVRPASDQPVELTVNPEQMVLSQDAAATISFQLPPGMGDQPSVDDLLIRVSSGEVSGVVSMGGGRFSARYTPPQVNYPHLAIVTVVDRRDPHGARGRVAIPLQGKVDYPVTTTPNASIILRVGGRDYGPVTAGGDGRALVPIVVPPGVVGATMVTIIEGESTEEDLDLRVPEIRRLQLFPIQAGVPSDDELAVPVRVMVFDPTGQPDELANIDLTATAGRLSSPVHIGGGVYEATYTPPDGRTRMQATIQATLPGGTKQSDAVEITLVPALPASLTLSTEPDELAAAGTGLRVFARLADEAGTGLGGRSLLVRSAGATLKDDVVDLNGGDYRLDFTADQGTDVSVQVVAMGKPSGNALHRIVVLPSREFMPADGVTSETVTIVTTDEFGYPVPQVEVSLSVNGSGSLPSTVTTDASGFAQVFYTAGSAVGLTGIEATAGGYRAEAPIVLGIASTLDLPVSGTADDVRVAAAWEGMQGEVLVRREGASAQPVVSKEAPSGTLASLELSAEPSVVALGGSVMVKVRALDEAGRGVSGQKLDFLASGGARFGTVSDLGGGDYQAQLSVPKDTGDVVKVSVMSDSGVAALLEVSVTATGAATADSDQPWTKDSGAWGSTPTAATEEPNPTPETAETASVTPTPTRPASSKKAYDRPWLRARLSFVLASYSYSQTPTEQSGTLLPTELSWGGGNGGAAIPLGGEFATRGHVPSIPYIGWNASFRYLRYSVASATFSEDAIDNLFATKVSLVGRYPFAVGREEISVGARVGFRYDDFVMFRGCNDPGCVVTYEPLGIPGLDVGAEVGAEFWKMYFTAAASAGIAYGTQPYAVGVDANLGWNVTKNIFIDAGFTWQRRTAELQGTESGQIRGALADEQLGANVGIGFSM